MVQNIFKGLGSALITPFCEDGSVDYNSLKRLVQYQLDNGADFLTIHPRLRTDMFTSGTCDFDVSIELAEKLSVPVIHSGISLVIHIPLLLALSNIEAKQSILKLLRHQEMLHSMPLKSLS